MHKTLVILTPAFPADENDSAWVPSKQLLVKKLKEIFPDVKVIVLSFLYPYLTNVYTWHKVEVIPFNGMHQRKLARAALWIRVWKKLAALNRQENIIGIYSFWCGECTLVARYFAKHNRLKHFCWISGMDALKKNKFVKYIRPGPEELVAMSLFLVEQFEKDHGIKPSHVIPIGIDPTEYGPLSAARDIDLLAAGSFNDFKQYDQFIGVVKDMSPLYPSIKAVICGDGTERPALEKMITQLQLESNITIVGMLPHSEVLQYMQRTKIFIHPSSYEGFGAVCIEALYAGAKVISYCDPMKLQIPEWTIAKNQHEISDAVKRILEEPIRHYPVLLYSMEDSAKAVMKLFEEWVMP